MDELLLQSEELYERFGKPLEAEHWGAYVAISADGTILLDGDIDRLSQKALEALGRGAFIFKVGDKEVGRWR